MSEVMGILALLSLGAFGGLIGAGVTYVLLGREQIRLMRAHVQVIEAWLGEDEAARSAGEDGR